MTITVDFLLLDNVKTDSTMDSTKKTLIIEDESEKEEEDIDITTYDQSIPSTSRNKPMEKRSTSKIKNIQEI